MEFDQTIQLIAGTKILDPVLNAAGFSFQMDTTGKGSGGAFACGRYFREERSLELHYRWGLGIVRYHIADAELDHLVYLKLIGVYGDSAFASVQLDKGIEGFYLLLDDLARFGDDFLRGDGKHFRALAAKFANDPSMFSGIRAVDSG